MTWPASDVNTTNADASTDSPATFRTDVLDLLTKFNLLRNHVSTFFQGVLSSTTASAAKTALGVTEPLGVGQTLQSLTGSRALATTYTNSTGRTIEVNITIYSSSYPGVFRLTGVIDGTAIEQQSGYIPSAGTEYQSLKLLVKSGSTYSATAINGTLSNWTELR